MSNKKGAGIMFLLTESFHCIVYSAFQGVYNILPTHFYTFSCLLSVGAYCLLCQMSVGAYCLLCQMSVGAYCLLCQMSVGAYCASIGTAYR